MEYYIDLMDLLEYGSGLGHARGDYMVKSIDIMVDAIRGENGIFMANALNYEVKVSNFDGAGTKITEHTLNDKLHRTNGPARVWTDGDFSWWLHGCRHRYYGPAASWSGWVIMDKTVRYRQW